jgi:archaellum component FlaC
MTDFSNFLGYLLTSSIIFAIIGISWQFMKLLSRVTDGIGELKITNTKVNSLLDKIEKDYETVSKTINNVNKSIEIINEEVILPIQSIGKIFKLINKLFENIYTKFLPSEKE